MPFDNAGFAEQDTAVVAHLRMARERLVQGWCQNYLYNGGQYCAVGAIVMGNCWSSSVPLPAQAALNILHLVRTGTAGDAWLETVIWNNSIFRTKKQILKAFDDAIVYAKEHNL